MKRDENNKLIYHRLNAFEPMTHDIINENGIDTKWECIYEKVQVYTDSGNPLEVLKFCNFGRIFCYDTNKETLDSITILKNNHNIVQERIKQINKQFNANQNCLGFCVLDGEYWLNLTPENLNVILSEDNYFETEHCNADHLIIYYKDSIAVHISKYFANENHYRHKIGCNGHQIWQTNDISNIYNYDSIKLFRKNGS